MENNSLASGCGHHLVVIRYEGVGGTVAHETLLANCTLWTTQLESRASLATRTRTRVDRAQLDDCVTASTICEYDFTRNAPHYSTGPAQHLHRQVQEAVTPTHGFEIFMMPTGSRSKRNGTEWAQAWCSAGQLCCSCAPASGLQGPQEAAPQSLPYCFQVAASRTSQTL